VHLAFLLYRAKSWTKIFTTDINENTTWLLRLFAPLAKQESSAKLTNQRVSYAFSSGPFSFHARHILPASKFQHSDSCSIVILAFY